MFPLKKKKISGYSFGSPTFYNSFHTGVDYAAKYVEYYAPFSGKATSGEGVQGGKFWQLITPDGHKFIARHLSQIIKTGIVKEGELVAITGNTGKFTTKPHLHQEVYKNNRLVDPEKFIWEPLKTTFMEITIIANKITWDYKSNLPKLSEWIKTYSSGRLEAVFDTKETSFDTVPLAPFLGKQAVDINWYRQHITPLGKGQVTLLLLNPEQYQNNDSVWGFMTYGDQDAPVRTEVSCYDDPTYPEAPLFVHRAFHEIAHALFFLTGQPDRVHEMLFQNPVKRKELLDLIDYQKLQEALIKIKPTLMNQAKIVKSKSSPKVYVCYEMPSMEYLNTKANIEGFVVPAQIPNSDSL